MSQRLHQHHRHHTIANVVMCRPTYVPRLDGERSWLPSGEPLDPGIAVEQWEGLRALVNEVIAPVVELQAEPWAPAMTFARDVALSTDGQVVPLMAHQARGPFEAPLVRRQLCRLGVELTTHSKPLRLDGGNVLPDSHGRLLIGVTTDAPNNDIIDAARFLEAATNRAAYRVPLVGGRFPHVDMAICDLNGRAWLVYPGALLGFDRTDPAWRDLLPGPIIIVEPADGEQLACNLFVHGNVAIGPELSTGLQQQIEAHGVVYYPTVLTELTKAGGGAHCLTLELQTGC